MLDFFYQYPIIKWILIGAGVLYFLDKYGIFSPVDNLINLIGKYKFKSHGHLNDPQLKQLSEYFNKKQYSNVEQLFKSFNASKRSFAFENLGQYGDPNVTEEWIEKDADYDLPKIIKAYQLIHKAWEIRGRGTIDSVSNQKQVAFKKHLKKAENILIATDPKTGVYRTNIVSCLLTIYKALDANRLYVHELFENTVKDFPDDVELHFSYLAFVSPKWGGTVEEYESYLNRLDQWSPFIQKLILAQYYFDLNYFQDYQDPDGRINQLMSEVQAQPIDTNNPYRYELYKLLYWTATNLDLDQYQTYYKKMAAPYLTD